jgi:multidrug efflux pump subunit AcrA (membrane-fusion protein)
METDLPQDPSNRRSRARRWRWGLGIAIALLVLVTVAWAGVRAGTLLVKSRPPLARMVGQPLPVMVGRVTREPVKEVIGGTTLAQPLMSISVNVAVTEGLVRSVRAEVGKLVQRNDALVEFDTNLFREAQERARQQVETARSELRKIEQESQSRLGELQSGLAAVKERVAAQQVVVETAATMHQRLQTLLAQKVVALAEVEQARLKWEEAKSALATARLDLVRAQNELDNEPTARRALLDAARLKLGQAEQELALARRNMNNTVVRAPSTGVIGQRSVDPGEWVANGKALFSLDLIETVYAVAEIEQEKAPYVSVGQAAEVVFDSHPTRTFRGPVEKIEPGIDPTKRTFKTFVRLANPGAALRPGMAGFSRITRTREVILMPRIAAINPTGSPALEATVFVVEDDRAVLRKVKLGRPEGLGRVEVLGGLKPGEMVMVHGQKDVNAGDRVIAKVLDPAQGSAAPPDAPGGQAARR